MFGPQMTWIVGIGSLFFVVVLLSVFLFSPQVFYLSGRNILRNKRRTTITSLVICFGLTGLMLLCGFIENAFKTLREGTITSGLGHVQLYKKGYHVQGVIEKAKYCIDDYENIKTILKEDPILAPEIKMIAAELDFTGLAASRETSAPCMGRGVEVDKDFLLSTFDRLVEGEQLSLDGLPDDGLVGKGLSGALGAKLDGVLTLLVVTKSGALNALDMTVRGIVQGAAKEYDDTILKLSLQHAQRLMARKDVSKIVILLKHTQKTDEMAKRLDEIIKAKNLNIEYKTWVELAQFYHGVRGLYRGMFIVFLSIIFVVAVLSVLNTMTMSVMERVREIGTLRALGTSRKSTIKIFLVEGLMLGVIGALVAIFVTLFIAFMINYVKGGILLPPPPGRTFGYQAYFDVPEHPWILFFGFLVSMVTCLVSSILPAIKASKMNIVDALRHY